MDAPTTPSARAVWCAQSDCVRFGVAALVLVPIFLLLGLSFFRPGAEGTVTGLLAALTGVLGFYFGGQQAAMAEGRALDADEDRARIATTATASTDRMRRLEQEVDDLRAANRLANRALEAARTIPGVDAKVQEVLRDMNGGGRA